MVTGRDQVHHYLVDQDEPPTDLNGAVLYHCGPVMLKDDHGGWRVAAAGPTTSIREEPYQADVIEKFGIRAVMGKGDLFLPYDVRLRTNFAFISDNQYVIDFDEMRLHRTDRFLESTAFASPESVGSMAIGIRPAPANCSTWSRWAARSSSGFASAWIRT